MNQHLREIAKQVVPGAHAVVVLDQAGWHQTGGRLRVPVNISLLHLPPYIPEFNPVENVWEHLRQNQLANRVYSNYDAILNACCRTLNSFTADIPRLQSITQRQYAQVIT